MKSKPKRSEIRQRKVAHGQQGLFPLYDPQPEKSGPLACQIMPVGKRRDGGTRYWCLSHKADATAKYGKPATTCRAAHVLPIPPEDTFNLYTSKYPGGVALWGAVPPVYDTTRHPIDRGIHVHARTTVDGKKDIDRTYRAVRLFSDGLPKQGALISELDAIYYMVSSVFGYEMRQVECSYCGYPHLDKDWFSVHPHRRHLCAGCGKQFRDTVIGIGNPIYGVKSAAGVTTQQPIAATKILDIRQDDYPGGIQIWGSNPAFIWTSPSSEHEGIHVHAFKTDSGHPDEDDTFSKVTIDGITLDPTMVRTLMAQSALPHIDKRVVSTDCPKCRTPHFSAGEQAFTPAAEHQCQKCRHQVQARGRLRNVVANPLLAVLDSLADNAPRRPQKHQLNLLPETL